MIETVTRTHAQLTYLSLRHDDDDGDVLSMMIDLMMDENESAKMEWENEET